MGRLMYTDNGLILLNNKSLFLSGVLKHYRSQTYPPILHLRLSGPEGCRRAGRRERWFWITMYYTLYSPDTHHGGGPGKKERAPRLEPTLSNSQFMPPPHWAWAQPTQNPLGSREGGSRGASLFGDLMAELTNVSECLVDNGLILLRLLYE